MAEGPGASVEGEVLNAPNTLAGCMIAVSGRRLVLAAFAGDVPRVAGATAAMDAALKANAAANQKRVRESVHAQ
ncbi:hypothetical protein [Sphingomonas sp.]|uniref:hypothetical protein n=1 Tax=Sphingomonas sp. TaxID=28214 RepID=UPI003B0073A9